MINYDYILFYVIAYIFGTNNHKIQKIYELV